MSDNCPDFVYSVKIADFLNGSIARSSRPGCFGSWSSGDWVDLGGRDDLAQGSGSWMN